MISLGISQSRRGKRVNADALFDYALVGRLGRGSNEIERHRRIEGLVRRTAVTPTSILLWTRFRPSARGWGVAAPAVTMTTTRYSTSG